MPRHSILGHPSNQQTKQPSQRIYSSQSNNNFNNISQHRMYQNNSKYSNNNYRLQQRGPNQMYSGMLNKNNQFNHHGYNQMHLNQMMRNQQFGSNYYGQKDMHSSFNSCSPNQFFNNYSPINSQHLSLNSGYALNYMDQNGNFFSVKNDFEN